MIATSDGDFVTLVSQLYKADKLGAVISPSPRGCSLLLKQAAKERLVFLGDLWEKLE